MVEAIIHRGDSGSASSDLLKNSALEPLNSGKTDVFRMTFNGVYSSRIEKAPVEEEESDSGAAEALSPAAAAFLAHMMKTPEELYFERILKEKGLTPEQFEMLPQKEKAALREEIMEEVRLRMEEDAVKKAAGKEV
ncbi:hypothetical protein [Nisaea sp.]|uniref:hypothetical protein n=1 Tax=Nisaea sp. TaxID=2024842 RepID=UPI003B5232DF